MPLSDITSKDKELLLNIARQSIELGIKTHTPLKVETKNYPPHLQQTCATFVTLNMHHKLRGCIGTLTAYQPLVNDVSEHAFAAAFHDPRFPPVSAEELPLLEIHISLLTPAEPMEFSSEEDLIAKIQPGIDGLILESGPQKGTFLPSVWESLPEPEQFIQHLKLKAGLSKNFWDKNIKISRYRTISIS
ncbi:MAG: AmmeMemoRadiSam system protein A [Gammaproteobacteria bacterium]|nr:AmmeMemoRadiSam system protein A [Gammaproteobacteria bacterium]MDH5735728.1 AmmeMemoRadiSam system protein A [Gammaproteobacteria bacterium]